MNQILTLALAMSAILTAMAKMPPLTLATLKVQGDEYASTCIPSHRATRQQDLEARLGNARAADASSLIETLLCEKKSVATRALLASRMGKRVPVITAGTGDLDRAQETAVTAELIDSLQREGAAWNAELKVTPAEIELQYISDEACIQSRNLRASRGKWHIVRLGEACD